MNRPATRLFRGAMAGALVLAVAACGASGAAVNGTDATPSSPPPSAGSGKAAKAGEGGTSAVDQFKSPRTYHDVAEPVRIRIPSEDVDSKLGRVGLAADGTIDAPKLWQQAAWYDKGPRPGQEGPAVIVGHVDSKSGPAVFYRIGDLHAGAKILVDLADGTTETFKVRSRSEFPKAGFPAGQVYSPTLKPSLLLITCGGTFDSSTGHYRDNVVVTAVPG